MLQIQTHLRRLLDRVESRFARSRPGSVMILVIVLLVLMAMLGTAYLVTARNDRVATRLYSHNVQIDILLDNVVSMAQLAVSDAPIPGTTAVTAPPAFQAAPPPIPASTAGAGWNAGTIPVINGTTLVPALPGGTAGGPAYWPNPYQPMMPGYYPHYDDFYSTGMTVTARPASAASSIVGGSFYYTAANTPPQPSMSTLQTGLGVSRQWLASRYPYQVAVDTTGLTLPNFDTVGLGADAIYTYTGLPYSFAAPYTSYINPLVYTPQNTVPLSLLPLPDPTLENPIKVGPSANWQTWHGMPFPMGVIITSAGGYYINTLDNNVLPPTSNNNIPIGVGGLVNAGWQNIHSPPYPTKAVLPIYPAGKTTINTGMWPAISAPLVIGATFEDPRYNYLADSASNPQLVPAPPPMYSVFDPRAGPSAPAAPLGTVGVRPDGARTNVSPCVVNVGGINYPGMTYFSYIHNQIETALAASASGDGIADSFLWRLPVSSVDGITYYAAVRIIDNNSAINVNTANSQATEFDALGNDMGLDPGIGGQDHDPAFMPGTFPSEIGLDTILNTFAADPTGNVILFNQPFTDIFPSPNPGTVQSLGSELATLNQYRLGNYALPPYNSSNYYRPSGIFKNIGTHPYEDIPLLLLTPPLLSYLPPRSDFGFRNLGDALWNGMGRRLLQTAYTTQTSASQIGASGNFRAFNWDDSAALAYKFDLVNANVTPTALETILSPSVLAPPNTTAYASTPWDPSQTANWYQHNYQEGGAGSGGGGVNLSNLNRRAFLTAHNPTSNLMPAHSMYNMLWPTDPYGFIDPPAPTAAVPVPPLDYTPRSLVGNTQLIQQNQDIQALMGGSAFGSPTATPGNYVTVINPLINDPAAPVNRVPPTPRVSLNTADITAADPLPATTPVITVPLAAGAFPPPNNLNIPATVNNIPPPLGVPTPIKGPSLWLGFYNAMIDAVAPNFLNPNSVAPHPGNGYGLPYVSDSPQHFLPAIVQTGANPGPIPKVCPPRLGQFRSPLRDVNYVPFQFNSLSGNSNTPAANTTPNASNYMDGNQVVLLRSLIAAVNAKDLRDSDDNVTHVQAAVYPTPGGIPAPAGTSPNRDVLSAFFGTATPSANGMVAAAPTLALPIDVHVYGIEKQPYITEVYVNTELQAPKNIAGTANMAVSNPYFLLHLKNPAGYVAVQLYNPYDVPIDMSGWTLGIMNRSTAVNYSKTGPPQMSMQAITTGPTKFSGFSGAAAKIPPKSFLVLENYNGGTPNGNDATYRPFGYYPIKGATPPSATPTGIGTATSYYVPGLSQVLGTDGTPTTGGGELFLLRQLPAAGTVTTAMVPGNVLPAIVPPTTTFKYSELTQLAPVDTFDFSGMTLPANLDPTQQIVAAAFHYVRPTTNEASPPPQPTAPTPAQLIAYQTALAAWLQSNWRFVYPGRWDPNKFTVNLPPGVQNNTPTVVGSKAALYTTMNLRQEGIAVSAWNLTLDATVAANYPNALDCWNQTPPSPGPPATANPLCTPHGVTWTPAFQVANPDVAPLTALAAYLINFNNYYKQPLSFGGFSYVPPVPTSATVPVAIPAIPGCTYVNNFPAIQLNNTDFGGPSKINVNNQAAGTNLMFPFGGFARVGDVLQVPYIGSYMILAQPVPGAAGLPAVIYEINPVTTDSSLADDNDTDQASVMAPAAIFGAGDAWAPSDDSIEQIGRFCPLTAADPMNQVLKIYQPTPTVANPYLPMTDSYAWASHIFDYFTTVTNPNDDYVPNVDPNAYSAGPWTGFPTNQYMAPGGNISRPVPQSNSAAGPKTNGPAEDLAPVEGLININTASIGVLQRIPWSAMTGAFNSTPVQAYYYNLGVATSIVKYRNTYGAFKTLFDLNKVPYTGGPLAGFPVDPVTNKQIVPPTLQYMFGADPVTAEYSSIYGNMSPALPLNANSQLSGSGPTAHVTNDFKTRFATVVRFSNILTTRSDTFTAYILVQGWSGAGTGTPTLAVQRRAAMIIDRTSLNGKTNAGLNITTMTAN